MQHASRHSWRPTDTALMPWAFFAAIVMGLMVTIVLGPPLDLLPYRFGWGAAT